MLDVRNSGQISSSTFGDGHAGSVTVEAGQLQINGQEAEFFTGIASAAADASIGNAGSVHVSASEININRGQISSSTLGAGDAGSVSVEATETLDVLNGGQIDSSTFATGDAKSVMVEAAQLHIDGQGSGLFTGVASTANYGTGDAGSVQVKVNKLLAIVPGGQIGSSTFTSGDAGKTNVEVTQLRIDGKGSNFFTGITSSAQPESTGNAGIIQVKATDQLAIVNGGVIDSSTHAEGDAGSISVEAANLLIDDQMAEVGTGISSNSFPGSTGDAGKIQVTANDSISMLNGGVIISNTFSPGAAGSISISANDIAIVGRQTGIVSTAEQASSGKVGSVAISAPKIRVADGGAISIGNFAMAPGGESAASQAGQIKLEARRIELANGAQVTAESVGNFPASDIFIHTSRRVLANDSHITTAAANADGGGIDITGGSVVLRGAQVTTSVAGRTGDGGNITLSPNVLIMDTGFIQANTTAPGGRGGNVNVETPALLVNGGISNLTVGGSPVPFLPGRNVIQAAAPEGVSGEVTISVPDFEVTSGLVELPSTFLDLSKLAQDPCAVEQGALRGSLTAVGRGGLPVSATASGSIFLGGKRLNQALAMPGANPRVSHRTLLPGGHLPGLASTALNDANQTHNISCQGI